MHAFSLIFKKGGFFSKIWIKRYVHFHQMRCREDLAEGEKKIEVFLTDLAVRGAGRRLDAEPGVWGLRVEPSCDRQGWCLGFILG